MAFKEILTPILGPAADVPKDETTPEFMNMKFGELLENTNVLNSAKIAKTQIKNTLTETATGNVLDATRGKALNDAKLDKTGGTISGALDVTGALTNGGKVVATQDAMTNITALNGWAAANTGTGYNQFKVTRCGKIGVVSGYLQGGVKTANTILGVLPAGFLPAFSISIPAMDESGYVTKFLNITPNGNISIGSLAYTGNIFFCSSYIIA